MTDAPERIWAEQTGHFMKDGIYYNGGKWNDDEESGMTAFIRLDLHEAAVAAARAEGWNEALEKAAQDQDRRVEYWTRRLEAPGIKKSSVGATQGRIAGHFSAAETIRAMKVRP